MPFLVDRELGVARFLKPGEKVLTNYEKKARPHINLPSLRKYVKELRESGQFESVRTSKRDVTDIDGRHYDDGNTVAIIVKYKLPVH